MFAAETADLRRVSTHGDVPAEKFCDILALGLSHLGTYWGPFLWGT